MLTLQSILDQLRSKACKGAMGVFVALYKLKDTESAQGKQVAEIFDLWQETGKFIFLFH